MSPYLWTRGERFYFRMHVPKPLQHYFGCDQIRIALNIRMVKPGDKLEDFANKECSRHELELTELFSKLRRHAKTKNVFSSERDIAEAVSHYRPSRAKRADMITVRGLAAKYFEHAKPRWSLKTAEETWSSILTCVTFLNGKAENRNCRDVRVRDAEELLQHLMNGREPKTVNKLMCRIDDVFAFGKARHYTDDNPMEGIRAETVDKAKKSGEKPRVSLSDQQINDIMELIAFKADREKDPSLFWVPMIAIYHGMRLTECCQLFKDDIITDDPKTGGVAYFRVDNRHEGQTLKNVPSRRNVPIHSNFLKYYGFLEYLKSFEHERCFPDLNPFKYGYGHSFKKFMPLFRKLISQDERHDFHSIRHSFITKLAASGFDSIRRCDVVGHQRESGTMSDTVYADKSKVEALKELIESMSNTYFH